MNSLRRLFLITAAIAGMTSAASAIPPFPSRRTGASRPPDLHDQLQKGLKARRPEEFEFIDRVVTLVDQGKLSLKLVNSSYGFAKKRAAQQRRDYPIVYFRRALEVQADRAGIDLNQPLN